MVLIWTFFPTLEADIYLDVEKRGCHVLFATSLGDVVLKLTLGDFLGLFNKNLSILLLHFAAREDNSAIASWKLFRLVYCVKRDLKVT